jgi:two-component system response regulator PilR (NtrC family)
MQWDVLVISSDLEARRNLTRILEDQGSDLPCAPNIHGAIELLEREAGHSIGLIFCDRDLPDGNFRDFLTVLRSLKNKTRVVVTSRLADWDEYLNAMRLGAFEVIAAPCRPADVEWMLTQAARDLRESAAITGTNSGWHRAANAG